MHIQKIAILNLLGIEHLEFEAGAFTTISGPNGVGKTSVLESIKAALEGGTDATLLRKGQKTGEVVLVLDDGTTIKRRLTPSTTTTTVEKDGVASLKPMSAIKSIIDSLSVNPVDFLKAPKKDRTRVLLESLPTQADPERIREIIGDATFDVSGANALEQIDRAHQSVFQDRTGTNRAVREKQASINQLENTLPPDDGSAPAGDTDSLEQKIAAIDARRDAELEAVEAKLVEYRAQNVGRLGEFERSKDALRGQITELQARIAVLDADVGKEREWMITTEAKANAKRGSIREAATAEAAPVATQLQVIRSNVGAASRAEQTRATIKTFAGELTTLEADAERQSAALEALDAYKLELMAKLPIEGLTVNDDGEICRNGIVFDRLNTAQQVDIAVDLAKLRAGELGIICVDGLESLDTAHWHAFKEKALASDLQLFVTRRTDGEFKIETTTTE